MDDRKQASVKFLENAGWQDAARQTVAGDASNRRYDRLTDPNGKTVILMDAPSEKGEDIRPFVRIAKYLQSIGLSAPKILTEDSTQGFLLLEDLGDDLFARILEHDTSLEPSLYKAAIDVLVHLHRASIPDLAAYDAKVMTDMSALAFVWYAPSEPAKNRFCEAFYETIEFLDGAPQVLIQRDYHAENLLWLPDRQGVARVGLLDFQDAMAGHAAYDLVSVLQDARRDVSPAIQSEMVTYYLSETGLDADSFKTAYAVLGAQRNLRILGVFARLCLRDGKAHYVDLIPRVWDHIMTNLKHPFLQNIADIIHEDLPPPTPEILEQLKSKCATIQNQ